MLQVKIRKEHILYIFIETVPHHHKFGEKFYSDHKDLPSIAKFSIDSENTLLTNFNLSQTSNKY